MFYIIHSILLPTLSKPMLNLFIYFNSLLTISWLLAVCLWNPPLTHLSVTANLTLATDSKPSIVSSPRHGIWEPSWLASYLSLQPHPWTSPASHFMLSNRKLPKASRTLHHAFVHSVLLACPLLPPNFCPNNHFCSTLKVQLNISASRRLYPVLCRHALSLCFLGAFIPATFHMVLKLFVLYPSFQWIASIRDGRHGILFSSLSSESSMMSGTCRYSIHVCGAEINQKN